MVGQDLKQTNKLQPVKEALSWTYRFKNEEDKEVKKRRKEEGKEDQTNYYLDK